MIFPPYRKFCSHQNMCLHVFYRIQNCLGSQRLRNVLAAGCIWNASSEPLDANNAKISCCNVVIWQIRTNFLNKMTGWGAEWHFSFLTRHQKQAHFQTSNSFSLQFFLNWICRLNVMMRNVKRLFRWPDYHRKKRSQAKLANSPKNLLWSASACHIGAGQIL